MSRPDGGVPRWPGGTSRFFGCPSARGATRAQERGSRSVDGLGHLPASEFAERPEGQVHQNAGERLSQRVQVLPRFGSIPASRCGRFHQKRACGKPRHAGGFMVAGRTGTSPFAGLRLQASSKTSVASGARGARARSPSARGHGHVQRSGPGEWTAGLMSCLGSTGGVSIPGPPRTAFPKTREQRARNCGASA